MNEAFEEWFKELFAYEGIDIRTKNKNAEIKPYLLIAFEAAQPKWLSVTKYPKEQQQINICLNSNIILFGRFINERYCEYDPINDKFIELKIEDIRCWIPILKLPEKYDV